MDTLRFPIRFGNDKRASVLEESSDEYFAQLLALAIQIQPGELVLSPNYGCVDPTFSEEARKSLVFTAASFIPEIQLQQVDISEVVDGKSSIDVSFTIREQ